MAESVRGMKGLFGPMRLPFLVLSPVCVLIGLGVADWSRAEIDALRTVMVMIGAIGAHICVNAFNEYFDFKSGLDAMTRRTPFSGGSGALPSNPALKGWALAVAISSALVVIAIGVYFVISISPVLLLFGVFGLFISIIYTPWLTRSPLLCLLAPGIGFGPLMVVGSEIVLSGNITWRGLVASLVPLFLVSDLLLLNQFPDTEADEKIGRKHYPITIGKKASSKIYLLFLVGAYLVIVLGVIAELLPPGTLLGLGSLPIAVFAGMTVIRQAADTEKLVPAMGLNVIVNLITPILVAVGFFIS